MEGEKASITETQRNRSRESANHHFLYIWWKFFFFCVCVFCKCVYIILFYIPFLSKWFMSKEFSEYEKSKHVRLQFHSPLFSLIRWAHATMPYFHESHHIISAN